MGRKVNRGRSDRAKGEEEQQGEKLRLGKSEGGRRKGRKQKRQAKRNDNSMSEENEKERMRKEISSTWPKQIYIGRDLARLALQKQTSTGRGERETFGTCAECERGLV